MSAFIYNIANWMRNQLQNTIFTQKSHFFSKNVIQYHQIWSNPRISHPRISQSASADQRTMTVVIYHFDQNGTDQQFQKRKFLDSEACPGLAYNKELQALEIIGDWTDGSNKNHSSLTHMYPDHFQKYQTHYSMAINGLKLSTVKMLGLWFFRTPKIDHSSVHNHPKHEVGFGRKLEQTS